MATVIAWCGFLGTWLLVVAAVYQAALELQGEELARDEIDEAKRVLKPEHQVSPWWWLFPPAGYVLHRRESRTYRNDVFNSLTFDQAEGLVHYLEKARGWTTLAFGAFFVAVEATWGIWERYGWPPPAFLVAVVVLLLASTTNTALRVRHSQRVLAAHHPRGNDGSDAGSGLTAGAVVVEPVDPANR